MVKGLDVFRKHFRGFSDRFLLIGGTACEIVLGEAAIDFRATKDLDVVLCAETLDRPFVNAIWSFVRLGGYRAYRKSTGRRQCHRFLKPEDADYPAMIELFSRVPDFLEVAEGSHLTPLPMDEYVSSLSAILLDSDYYAFMLSGRRELDGLPFVGAEHLIPLKARAWLDLTRRRTDMEDVQGASIKKHKNDVFRLFQVVRPDRDISAPEKIRADLREFLSRMETETVDLRALGIRGTTRVSVISALRTLYHLG